MGDLGFGPAGAFGAGRASKEALFAWAKQKTADVQAATEREIWEIEPIILGGDPVSPENKTSLNRKQHVEAVRYWNAVVQNLTNANLSKI